MALSSWSPPIEYGIRLLENAIPVSYLHPVKDGALLREPFSMVECTDFGEAVPMTLTGDGERAPKEALRACENGVDGTECELRGDR